MAKINEISLLLSFSLLGLVFVAGFGSVYAGTDVTPPVVTVPTNVTVPGLDEYLKFFISKRIIGNEGLLAEYGLVPMPVIEYIALLKKVKTLKFLSVFTMDGVSVVLEDCKKFVESEL